MNKSQKVIHILKALGRGIIGFMYVTVKIVSFTLINIEKILFWLCLKCGVVSRPNISDISFEQKFNDAQLKAMASKTNVNDMTLKEIQDRFGVSYRQARKIRDNIEEPLPISHYRQMSKAV